MSEKAPREQKIAKQYASTLEGIVKVGKSGTTFHWSDGQLIKRAHLEMIFNNAEEIRSNLVFSAYGRESTESADADRELLVEMVQDYITEGYRDVGIGSQPAPSQDTVRPISGGDVDRHPNFNSEDHDTQPIDWAQIRREALNEAESAYIRPVSGADSGGRIADEEFVLAAANQQKAKHDYQSLDVAPLTKKEQLQEKWDGVWRRVKASNPFKKRGQSNSQTLQQSDIPVYEGVRPLNLDAQVDVAPVKKRRSNSQTLQQSDIPVYEGVQPLNLDAQEDVAPVKKRRSNSQTLQQSDIPVYEGVQPLNLDAQEDTSEDWKGSSLSLKEKMGRATIGAFLLTAGAITVARYGDRIDLDLLDNDSGREAITHAVTEMPSESLFIEINPTEVGSSTPIMTPTPTELVENVTPLPTLADTASIPQGATATAAVPVATPHATEVAVTSTNTPHAYEASTTVAATEVATAATATPTAAATETVTLATFEPTQPVNNSEGTPTQKPEVQLTPTSTAVTETESKTTPESRGENYDGPRFTDENAESGDGFGVHSDSAEMNDGDDETELTPGAAEIANVSVQVDPSNGITHVLGKILEQAGCINISPAQLNEIYEDLVTDPNIGPDAIFTNRRIVIKYDEEMGEFRITEGIGETTYLEPAAAMVVEKYIPVEAR